MTEFERGYEQGYKDGTAGAALPNVNDNGDKIDGYSYAYKTDSNGEPYIHIDSVRNMLKKAADVQPVKRGRWELTDNPSFRKCSKCGAWWSSDITDNCFTKYCPKCGARMDGGAENDNNG